MYTSNHLAGPQAAGYGTYPPLYYPTPQTLSVPHGLPSSYPPHSPSNPSSSAHPPEPAYPEPSQPYIYHPPPPPGNMHPPSQYHPPPDGKGEQYWKAGGVVTSNLEIFSRKKTQGLSHRGKEYSGNSNEQAGLNLERFEQGDKSLSG
mmetsp:Transcript_9703/g.17225  ORF Transcript_9703/g.17225 Transcript_9703/m.17225 type:complete len:147 (-) Transcript_9703:1783-2223(-)